MSIVNSTELREAVITELETYGISKDILLKDRHGVVSDICSAVESNMIDEIGSTVEVFGCTEEEDF